MIASTKGNNEMNYTEKSSFQGYAEATHKPRISFINDDIGTCYKCTDGGITNFGNTPEEAYSGLMQMRGK